MPLTDVQKLDFQVKLAGTLAADGGQSQDTVNLLYYRRTSISAPYSSGAFITALRNKFEASWLAVASASWNLDKLVVRCINSAIEAEVQATINLPGGVAGHALPGQNAMLISKRTALRGRSYMGRIYIPGVPESGSDGNALSAAHKALLDTLATKLTETVTDGNLVTYVPTILSVAQSTLTTDPATIIATPVNLMLARSILATMDSRRSKVTA